MKIAEDVPLALFSAMRLGGKAKYLVHIHSEEELEPALDWAKKHEVSVLMLGGGANIIFGDKGYKGLVIVNDIKGLEISKVGKTTVLDMGAGEIWDDVVAKSTELGLTGIEALSKIPGKAGAAPVQNIGAYGQEIASVVESVRAYDLKKREFVEFSAHDCHFAYRSSRFNREDKGRYYITKLTLKLSEGTLTPPFYRDIQAYIERNDVKEISPKVIRQIVTKIRSKKLPDPSVVPNNGSFFYNPIVTHTQFEKLSKKFPEINEPLPGWSQPPRWFLPGGQVKISAAWLIEEAGFSAHDDPKLGLALWPHQNLVIINKSATKTADLLSFKRKLVNGVYKKFGIELQQEPELID